MKTTLKDLKKNKGIKKEFKFLTPLSELIEKEYKEIIPSFSTENYKEATIEVFREHKYLAFYDSSTTLRTAIAKDYNHGINFRPGKKKEDASFSTLQIQLDTTYKNPAVTLKLESGTWGSQSTLGLDELFVVTDEKAFEDFVLEYLIKEERERIESIKERAKENKEEVKTKVERIMRFGKEVDENSYNSKAADLILALEESADKDKLEKVSEVIRRVETRW